MSRFRKLIPQMRIVAFVMTGLTVGIFAVTGVAAMLWGYQPAYDIRVKGTLIAYAAILAVAAVLLLDRRKRDRPAQKS